jgi:hypothetical protein
MSSGIFFSFHCIDAVILECLCLDRTPDDVRETADLIYKVDLARLHYNASDSFFSLDSTELQNLEKKAFELLSRRRKRSQVA